ncbi:biopolymer transporter ExbD [Trichothermofontia sichuanensis B231]|uniref:ExbD/TolR family protein n=1 Tax=Trichothermofontia sichuanensis TaxID=3045816 RepID=UPI002245D88D|nr:biopolymer transporter ExbD [Trichothermofontia sichuanensis]UZQ55451.1 biopolymer transporter ExbD [Trichothermofontia sichuanensis B231]
MRFKSSPNNSLPQVNLVPMLDVLMTVLTFFIIIAMTLTGQQMINVKLPITERQANPQASPTTTQVEALVVGLDANGQIIMDNQIISTRELAERMSTYFAENPQGLVVLRADRDLTYAKVATLLKAMRAIGGDRVSLAFERS